MERILLALIINHPDLFDEVGENLAQLEFQTPEFEPLRQRVVDILSQAHDAPPNAAELRRHLSDPEEHSFSYNQSSSILDELLAQETYLHAKAAHPLAPPEEARKAWLAIWGTLEQGKIRADYETARALYREQPTEENERRMEALRNKVILFGNDMAESLAAASE